MAYSQANRADRIKAGAAAALLEALIGYALIAGIGVRVIPRAVEQQLAVFQILPEPPPPPIHEKPAPRKAMPKREGAASPQNLKASPTDIVAPRPPQIPVKPPIAATPRAGTGVAPSAGASNLPGPGTGSGGIGNGSGSGRGGNGSGGGGGSEAVQVRGEIGDQDIPKSARKTGFSGRVWVRYIVDTSGRATQCRVTRSSGDPEVDASTCRLIEQRYRFAPATDAQGRPIPEAEEEDHDWRRGNRTVDDDDGGANLGRQDNGDE